MHALMGGGTYAGVPVSELPENIRTLQQVFSNPALAEQVAGLQYTTDNPAAPKAHLNYLFFDDKMQLIPGLSGSIQVPVINGVGGGGWQVVDNTNICNCTIQGPGNGGFVLVYVDNQSIGKDVWFDDIHIEHYNSSVLSEDHYYPFGLTVNVRDNNTTE